MRRRTLLAAMLAVPAAASARAPLLRSNAGAGVLLHDGGLAIAARAASRAQAMGMAAIATGGEIAALLHATPLPALAGSGAVLGVTGYSEYVLAADIARRQGMALRLLGAAGTAADTPAESLLRQLLPREAETSTAIFAWIAAPRSQG